MALPKRNNEDQLSTLCKQYIRLKSSLEAVSYQIKRMGGTIPEIPEPSFIDINAAAAKTIFPKNSALLQREWSTKILATLESFSRPCSAKEISEKIAENEPDLYLSTVHIQVKFFINQLLQNGSIGALSDRRQKYFLK
jgi:hypothetical protein